MWANIYVGSAMIGWRERGILKRLSVTPVTAGAIIGTRVVSQVLFSLLQAAVFIAMAVAIYQVPIEGSLLALAALLFFGTLAMMGIGFIVGSFVNKSESAGTVTQLIAFPMMFFGGSYFSVAGAPQFMQPVIKAMPLTWLNEGLRQVFNQGAGFASSIVQLDLVVLFAWVAASLLIAVRLFRWEA
jgi:ABC-2 type transport system permease protein